MIKNFILSLIAALTFLLVVTPFDKAQACRDCPFPFKIGPNQWIMPGGNVLLKIYETKIGLKNYLYVELRDVETDEVLASGVTIRSRNQRTISLTLFDSLDRKISGVIYWVNFDMGTIRAKFECDQGVRCSIGGR